MTATFYVGDALRVMDTFPEKSVDLILSSPPFLALRSYLPADHPDKALEGGSQATPGAYIDWLVDVAEACARILAPHGSMCIELGDTYAGSGGGGGDYLEGGWREGQAQFAGSASSMRESNAAHWRQKNTNTSAWPLPKSLSLIPELFRLTLVYGQNPLTGRTTERWRLRNVIRWVRPNPPVGALGDKFRPATSELMVFCKSAKRFFDLDAVRDDTPRTEHYCNRQNEPSMQRGGQWSTFPDMMTQGGAPPLDWWNIPPGGYAGAHYAVWPPELCVKPIRSMCPEKVCKVCGEPSRRIVERDGSLNSDRPQAARAMQLAEDAGLTTEHFAAIRSFGISDTGKAMVTQTGAGNSERVKVLAAEAKKVLGGYFREFLLEVPATTGFSDCGCPETPAPLPASPASAGGGAGISSRWRPGLVLDPFVGSGTTLAVATGHGRDAIGIDLDERNYQLALKRVGPFMLEKAS